MAFINFNKAELVNLSYSLKREIISANKTGAYANTSIVACNTRRYHGLLAVPVDALGDGKFLLLSAIDESLLVGNHQFNLAIHCYGDHYEPKGHKYIVDFDADPVPQIVYKVGEVMFKKSLLLSPDSDQMMIRYDLLQAPSSVTVSLKPYLAFRNIHDLTHQNTDADTSCREVTNGVSFRMYDVYPDLNIQLSTSGFEYKHHPSWYNNITYSDEYRRGYDCIEDLLVPGTFTFQMREGESVVLSASTTEINPRGLKLRCSAIENKLKKIDSFQDLLVHNADLLKSRRKGKDRICAGFSWLETGLLRETLVSLPGLTLYADGNCDEFEAILDNLISDEQDRLLRKTTQIEAPLRLADVLQQYIAFVGDEEGIWKKYGSVLKSVIDSYAPGVRKEVSLHPNGLLWTQMDRVALSWMNAYVNGQPVTERAGYEVDTNAWWYDSLCFALNMEEKYGKDKVFIRKWERIRDVAKDSFYHVFWNDKSGYLADYVDNDGQHLEVRPNMMTAAYVHNSPLDDETKSKVMWVVKNELLTKRGIRTLSPRNVNYRGVYEGPQIDRDLAYHQGCTRPELLGPYFDVFFRMIGPSFCKRAEYLLEGFYEDMGRHGVGAFSELYDGDPPHEPHGAIMSACATAALLWCEYLIAKNKVLKGINNVR